MILALIFDAGRWMTAPENVSPKFAPALNHTQAAAEQQGQPTTASETLVKFERDLTVARDAAAHDPKAWQPVADAGSILLARARLTGSFDDYAAAGQAFDAAFRVAAPGTGPHLDRAAWLVAVHRLGPVEANLAALDRYAIRDQAATASALGLKGDVAFSRGHYAEALDRYRASQALIPSAPASLRLADYYAHMGDPEAAQGWIDQAQSHVTGPQQQLLSFIEMRRGVVDLGRGRWNAADAHFVRAEDIFPGTWAVRQYRATMLALRGRVPEAIAMLSRESGRPEAADALAGLYRALGDFEKSQVWAKRAGALWDHRLKQLPEAAYGHALDHYLNFGDPARALDLAKRNYALRPNGEAASGLAWAILANHRPDDALAVIKPVIGSGWVSAEAHIAAAEAYALLGKGSEAEAERHAALAINPHSLDRNPGVIWLHQ